MHIDTEQITIAQVAAIKSDVIRAIDAGDDTLDFSGVSRVDSSAVALVLFAKRYACEKAMELKLVGVPPSFYKLALLYGLETLFAQDKEKIKD